MRVLIVRGFPEVIHLNGYNSQELGLARALRQKGHLCDIVYYCGREPDHTQIMEDGIRIFWRHGRNLLKNGIMPGLRELAEGYDVVQVNEYDQLESWLFYTFYAFGKKGMPVVIYNGNYDCDFNHGYNLKCAVFDRTFLKITGKKREVIPCMSKSVLGKDFLEKKGFRNVRAVGVGLDVTPLEENPQHHIADGMPEGRFEILYVGKLEERRNIPFLLDVIEKAHTDCPRVHATIIGSGTDSYVAEIRGRLEQMQKADIVTYYEKAPQNELAAVYRKARMLLLPTSYEIFGMVLLEAMYYGCVPLTTLNGGSSVLIRNGENGFIADMDAGQWSRIIVDSAADKNRLHQMGRSAEYTVREHYTWEHLADVFAAVYRAAQTAAQEV